MNILVGYLLSFFYVFSLLAIVSIIKKISKGRYHDTYRKLVHIFVVFTWIPMCKYLYGTWHFVIIPFAFIIVTALSSKYNFIKVVARDSQDGKDYGIVHYSISMTILCATAYFFPICFIPCGIGVFVLSFGDGTAAVFGRAFTKRNLCLTKTKTLIGSISCSVFAILGTIIFRLLIPFPLKIAHLLIIGVIAALMEIVGGRYDNYTVPFGTMITAVLLNIGEV